MAGFALAAENLGDAQTVAWACFVVGVALVIVGVGFAIYVYLSVKPKVEKVQEGLVEVAMAAPGAEVDAAQIDARKTALEQAGSIIGSLPENLRFPGLLVVLGIVLMSVATIQFGGVSLF